MGVLVPREAAVQGGQLLHCRW